MGAPGFEFWVERCKNLHRDGRIFERPDGTRVILTRAFFAKGKDRQTKLFQGADCARLFEANCLFEEWRRKYPKDYRQEPDGVEVIITRGIFAKRTNWHVEYFLWHHLKSIQKPEVQALLDAECDLNAVIAELSYLGQSLRKKKSLAILNVSEAADLQWRLKRLRSRAKRAWNLLQKLDASNDAESFEEFTRVLRGKGAPKGSDRLFIESHVDLTPAKLRDKMIHEAPDLIPDDFRDGAGGYYRAALREWLEDKLRDIRKAENQ